MFSKKYALVVLICFTTFFPKAVFAQGGEGLSMMNRMIQAFSQLSYEGIFVRSHGAEINSMKIRHTVIEGVEYESLVDLDGDKIEVIRKGDSVICVYPNVSFSNKRDPITTPFQKFSELDSARVSQGYDFILGEKALVAGREAQKLELRPKDQYRFAHDFWLDSETGLLLRHDTLDAPHTVLDRLQFTSLDTEPKLQAQDFKPRKGSYTEHVVKVDPQIVARQWSFKWLPAGFAPVWDEARKMNDKATTMLVSDGITSISVFIEPATQEEGLSITKMGSTVAGEKTAMMNGHYFLITAVGEVPDRTISKLLTMITPRDEQ